MDAVLPPPHAEVAQASDKVARPAEVRLGPAAQFPAATDYRPRSEEERDLCKRASRPDWLYLAGLVVLDTGAILLHPQIKYNESQAVRTLGAGFIGLSWGATLGGAVLSLPRCDPYFVAHAPPEGNVRAHWPLMLAVSTVSAATAPVLVGIVTGGLPNNWTYTERSTRLWIAAGSGFVGALLPYIPAISPKPWRASRELEKLRVAPMFEGGVAFSFTTKF